MAPNHVPWRPSVPGQSQQQACRSQLAIFNKAASFQYESDEQLSRAALDYSESLIFANLENLTCLGEALVTICAERFNGHANAEYANYVVEMFGLSRELASALIERARFENTTNIQLKNESSTTNASPSPGGQRAI
jgi:uncharacterized protein (DUF2141 family)